MLNKPSPRLQILREQLALEKFELQNARELYAHSAANPRTTHHTDHEYGYNEDLAEWLKSLVKKSEPLGDLQKAIPPAQPSASAWRRGTDIPVSERVGLWHNRCADGAVFPARRAGSLTFENLMYRHAAPGTKEGDKYDESRYATADLSARLADASSAASGAALVGAKLDSGLRYLVCVSDKNSSAGMIYAYATSEAAMHGYQSVLQMPDVDWRLCDKDGFIPHTPTADSKCPVPSGIVGIDVRLANGIVKLGDTPDGWRWSKSNDFDIAGWRPAAGAAA